MCYIQLSEHDKKLSLKMIKLIFLGSAVEIIKMISFVYRRASEKVREEKLMK